MSINQTLDDLYVKFTTAGVSTIIKITVVPTGKDRIRNAISKTKNAWNVM